jgi:MarR-like DNA-binding transcriptional regulator SgrR of sgrS sRNA
MPSYTITDSMSKAVQLLYPDSWANVGVTVDSIVWRDGHETTEEERTAIQTKFDEVDVERDLINLRHVRNNVLSETDWWMMPDRTATDEQIAYRQALRDITDTYTSLDDVVWPTKPE